MQQTEPNRHARVIFFAVLPLLAMGTCAVFLRDRLYAADTSQFIAATVTRGNVEETVLASGTFKPTKLVAVGAQVSGRITALKVRLGDRVQKGALVAEIDSVTQRNDIRTTQASLANVKAQRDESDAELENAQLTLERQQAIFDRQAGSKADLDSAKATLKKTTAQIAALDAQITAAKVAVETAEANLAYTHITAPMDGTVLAVVNQEGQTVNAAQSAPTIVILGQLDTMTVRAEISEADVVKVKTGQKVYFTILGDPDNPHSATLQSIEPAPESISSDSSVTSTTSSSSSSSSTSSSSSAIYYNGIFDVPNADGRFRSSVPLPEDGIDCVVLNLLPSGATPSTDGQFVDLTGTLSGWFEKCGAAIAVVRPDKYVFGIAPSLSDLPSLLRQLQARVPRPPLNQAHQSKRSAG